MLSIFVDEDYEPDLAWLNYLLYKTGAGYALDVSGDGEDAIPKLLGFAAAPASGRPHFAFIDLNMPKKGGSDVLASLPEDFPIPIYVLSGSLSERDVVMSKFGRLVSGYYQKPIALEEIRDLLTLYSEPIAA